MHYGVIGIQNDVETSLCVMEAYVPLFFKGALNIYKKMGMEQLTQYLIPSTLNNLTHGISNGTRSTNTPRKLLNNINRLFPLEFRKSFPFVKNETPHKQSISDLARNILANNMTLEYEFYEFVKHRLKLQVKSLRKQRFPRNWCSGKPIGGTLRRHLPIL